ncbi:MAG: tetratricopeptide repeat protein [Planctomycetota bacterium]|jgi:tetratricopeptide (TPR) repeat protein
MHIWVRDVRFTAFAAAVLTFVVYVPALRNGFVNLDDNANLVTNDGYRGLTFEHLRWMIDTRLMGHFQPLTWLTFAIDWTIWGEAEDGTPSAFGMHLTNIAFHAVNAGLLVVVCAQFLTSRRWADRISRDQDTDYSPKPADLIAAFATSFLFAVHPMRVESVAWLTERRDVVSLCFLLLTVWFWLLSRRQQTRRLWLALSLVCYLLSLLAKAWGVTLPAVLFLIDILLLQSISGRTLLSKATRSITGILPYAILAAPVAIAASAAQQTAGAMMDMTNYPLASRLLNIGYVILWYPTATLLPLNLHPAQTISVSALDNGVSGAAWYWGGLLTVTAGALAGLRKGKPELLCAWCAYAAMVMPVSGMAQSGFQLVADRYAYVATIPLLFLAGIAASRLLRWCRARRQKWTTSGTRRTGVILAMGSVAALLCALTVRQTTAWYDSESLWRHTIACDSDNTIAWANLGVALRRKGKVEAAESALRRATAFAEEQEQTSTDQYVNSLHNLALTLSDQGQVDEARQSWRRALASNPRHTESRTALTGGLVRDGQFEAALEILLHCHKSLPNDPSVNLQTGTTLLYLNRPHDAISYLRQSVSLETPSSMKLLAIAFERTGDHKSAVEALERYLRHVPEDTAARQMLLKLR